MIVYIAIDVPTIYHKEYSSKFQHIIYRSCCNGIEVSSIERGECYQKDSV